MNAPCVPECSADETACGPACCRRPLFCVDSPDGKRCDVCEKEEYKCGTSCCVSGETCTNRERGACSATWAAAKVGQSCGGGLVCPVPTLTGGMERADCCESLAIPRGVLPMGRSIDGRDRCPPETTCYKMELPEHPVTVSSFSLDRFEVTVGRFRNFVEGWTYAPPPPNTGAHPQIRGSGWQSAWNRQLSSSKETLERRVRCSYSTWTETAGTNEAFPINCVSWYEAFVFCAWDGGRLPTEAEWEFAAANGAENDLYPWGVEPPSSELALFRSDPSVRLQAVGSKPAGANHWGHRDLAGSVWEWVLDGYEEYSEVPSTDYASLDSAAGRVGHGGGWGGTVLAGLRAAARHANPPTYRFNDVGFRCARTR